MKHQDYTDMIHKLKEAKYSFMSFPEALEKNAKRKVILRHDVDVDLSGALAMAELERKEGVQSTYFLMLGCPTYNLFTAKNRILVGLIASSHHIGLHFNRLSYPPSGITTLTDRVRNEVDILSKIIDSTTNHKKDSITAISFHKPGDMEYLCPRISGIPHTYEPVFVDSANDGYTYFSDSSGKWKYGHPTESQAFEERLGLHILTHPVWYSESGTTPCIKLKRIMRVNTSQIKTYYEHDLTEAWENYDA